MARLRTLAAEQARIRPRRDFVLFGVHAAFAGSLLWGFQFWHFPRWILAFAAIELAVAVGALARWRVEPALIHVRACAYAAIASALVSLGIGGPLLVSLLAFHALVVWLFGRGALSRGKGATVPAGREAGGLLWSFQAYLARGRGTETLLPAAITWGLLISWLGSVTP